MVYCRQCLIGHHASRAKLLATGVLDKRACAARHRPQFPVRNTGDEPACAAGAARSRRIAYCDCGILLAVYRAWNRGNGPK